MKVRISPKLARRIGGSMAVLLVFALLLGAAWIVSPRVRALGTTYFDDSGTGNGCDLGTSTSGSPAQDNDACGSSEVRMEVGQGANVPHSVVQFAAYYNLPVNGSGGVDGSKITGNIQLSVVGANFCPDAATGANMNDDTNNGYYDTNGLNGMYGSPATDYQVIDATGYATVHSDTGWLRHATDDGCDSTYANVGSANAHYNTYTRVFNLNPSDFTPVPGVTGEFYVLFKATMDSAFIVPGTCSVSTPGGCAGIWNGFYVQETGNSAYTDYVATAAYDSSNSCSGQFGRCVSVHTGLNSNNGNPTSLIYRIRFGSDCSVSSGGSSENVNFYDLDFAPSNPVKLRLEDINANGAVRWRGGPASGYNDGSDGYGTWGKPAPSFNNSISVSSNNADASAMSFTAFPQHKYMLEILNVSPNLTMQYSTPFPGVYWGHQCSAALNPHTGWVEQGGPFAVGAVINATAGITNPKPLTATADWTRTIWWDKDNSKTINGTESAWRQTTGTTTVGGNSTNNFTNVAYTVLAGQTSGQICESLALANPNPNFTVLGTTTISCRPLGTATASPYFSVVGGDAAVGAGFSDTTGQCTTNNNAGIVANNAGPPTYNGAFTQMAALALGDLSGFVTGKWQVTQSGSTWRDSLPTAVDGSELAFSNDLTLASATPPIGGNAKFSPWCMPDYYDNANATPAANKSAIASSPTGTGAFGTSGKVYTYTGNLTINGGYIPADGRKITVLVTGNVYIAAAGTCTTGIYFSANSTCATSGAAAPTSAANIPSFTVIASGNITVAPGVTELDGFYVAQGGDFITCANSAGLGLTTATSPVAVPACNPQFKVNGAVAAKTLVPNRTSGDIAGNNSGGVYAPAEIFQYSPQMWLPTSGSGNGLGKWQAVTSLPPIL